MKLRRNPAPVHGIFINRCSSSYYYSDCNYSIVIYQGQSAGKQDDITDKPVVTTEQTTETEMSTEQTDRKDVSGQQEASEKTSEVINKEDTTGNEDMGTDGAVGEEEAEYILPESASRLLTEADLENLTQEDLRIARNEIYARHGRKFLDEGLQEYFNGNPGTTELLNRMISKKICYRR